MYYTHRFTWSGIALHEGHLPGYAASHGCIRMPTAFVSRLWAISKLGMRVVVARVELTPREISHAKLFNPAQKPVDTSRASEVPAGLRPSLDTIGQGFVRMAQAEPSATEPGITTDAPSAVEASATVPSPGAATETAATAEPATPAPAASDTAAAPAEPSPAATDVATTPAAANEPV